MCPCNNSSGKNIGVLCTETLLLCGLPGWHSPQQQPALQSRGLQCPCKAARASKEQPQREGGIFSKHRFNFNPAQAFTTSHMAATQGKVSSTSCWQTGASALEVNKSPFISIHMINSSHDKSPAVDQGAAQLLEWRCQGDKQDWHHFHTGCRYFLVYLLSKGPQ